MEGSSTQAISGNGAGVVFETVRYSTVITAVVLAILGSLHLGKIIHLSQVKNGWALAGPGIVLCLAAIFMQARHDDLLRVKNAQPEKSSSPTNSTSQPLLRGSFGSRSSPPRPIGPPSLFELARVGPLKSKGGTSRALTLIGKGGGTIIASVVIKADAIRTAPLTLPLDVDHEGDAYGHFSHVTHLEIHGPEGQLGPSEERPYTQISHKQGTITTLPRSIGSFQSLTVLVITDNLLTGLPASFAKLKLTKLDLSHNKYLSIPEVIRGGLQQLEVLTMAGNQIHSIPNWLLCKANLKGVVLRDNRITWLPSHEDLQEESCTITFLDVRKNPLEREPSLPEGIKVEFDEIQAT